MTRAPPDPALHLALRALACHRAALHHDRHARVAEQALALRARAHALRFITATRAAHPLAKHLRHHLRDATRARRQRDRLLPALATARAASLTGMRAKLSVARRFVDDTPAAALLHSLARDLRRLL